MTKCPAVLFFLTAAEGAEQEEADSDAVTPPLPPPEDPSIDAAAPSMPACESDPPQSDSQGKEPINSAAPELQSSESDPCLPPKAAKPGPSPAAPPPSASAPRHHETGALMVTKTTYVIPKKQPGPQPPSSNAPSSASSASGQKPPLAPTLLNETRNLLVPPAPSAPSSRPSQPNNQIRQSIQRSLSGILLKR